MKKASYTVSCSSAFRDEIIRLAERRQVNVGDLARSVMLLVPIAEVDAFTDPGEPAADDRETILLKSGPAAGKPWQRKPRLQVRLPEGFDPVSIRKALAMALAMDRGETALQLSGQGGRDETTERVRAVVGTLAFDPLPDGPTTRAEALHILGFAPGRIPDKTTLRQRFRQLAQILHPDSDYGDHQRMAQLNSAMDILRGAVA